MNAARVIVTVPAEDVAVVLHCEHDDGTGTFRIEHEGNEVTVYLQGTTEQLSELACKLSAAVAEWAIHQVEQASACR